MDNLSKEDVERITDYLIFAEWNRAAEESEAAEKKHLFGPEEETTIKKPAFNLS